MKEKAYLAVRNWMSAITLCAVVVAMALPALSQSTPRADRITGEVTAGGLVPLAGTVHPLTRRATDLGEVDSEMPLNSMTLNIGLSAAEQTDLNALLAAQQNPQSPQYHQWLTQEQYGARFGLTDSDLNKVTAWLESQGFVVHSISNSRNAISFGGKAWQVESAFHTQLHQYQWNGAKHFANASELQIPAALAKVVVNVRGLNDFRPQPRAHKGASPAYTADTTEGITNFMVPADWATIYDVNAIYTAGYTGAGEYVGVVGQTYAPESDINNFRSAAGLSPTYPTKLTYVCISSQDCTDAAGTSTGGDLVESDLDIEWSGGIAKGATVVFVYAAYDDPSLGVFDALQHAIQQYKVPATGTVLPVVGMSYGDCEESFASDPNAFSPSYQQWVTNLGTQASSQGQTIVVSSGDSGPATCDGDVGNYPAKLGTSVDIPADSPYYTGVGGTTLSGDEVSPTSYWNEAPVQANSNAIVLDSALGYIPETVWNDTSADNGLEASGGGVSQYFAQPTWQNGLIAGQTQWRMVPDVSFAASPNHDGYLICSQATESSPNNGQDCTNGFLGSQDSWDLEGGTSASAQAFSGLLTLLVQKFGPQGNINPTLYSLASNAATYATVFHDIKSGTNDVPCTVETSDPGCVGSQMGYAATAGYDMATGLGSVNGGALLTALAGTAKTATTTTVVASATSVAINGVLTSLTATVTPAAATGTVTFSVNGQTLGGGPVTISGGTAALSNEAVTTNNGFAIGSDTITATYSGDSNYAGSSGTTPLTVTAAVLTPTTTTVSATPNTATLNVTPTVLLTATVTPAAATGLVTFTVNGRTLQPSETVTGGTATVNIPPTTANGFTGGTDDMITAIYSGNTTYAASSGTTSLPVNVATYTLTTPSATTISLAAGATCTNCVTLNLVANGYPGLVTLTATSSNPAEITPTLSLSSVTLANGSASATLSITAAQSAANHSPAVPWRSPFKSGGALVLAVVLGAPFTLRKRRALAVLLTALAITVAGVLMSCSNGGSSTPATQSFKVTVSAAGTQGAVSSNPAAVIVTVNVP